MGIKTKLSKKDIKKYFDFSKMEKTYYGSTNTVYILDDRYILKLFEKNSLKEVNREIKFLKKCKKLKVSRVIKKTFLLQNKPAVIYKKSKGEVLKKVNSNSIKQIGKFLKRFHKLSKNLKSQNKKIFQKSYLKKLIQQTNNQDFIKIFNTIDIKLRDDGVIHGDLFVDNVNFKKDKLCCVYDFNQACNGDFLFDLAVASISWCQTKKDIKTLLNSYGAHLKYKQFKSYIKYALLYYSVARYLNNQNYQELFRRIDCI